MDSAVACEPAEAIFSSCWRASGEHCLKQSPMGNMIKVSIHHKDITNVNMYAPNIGASKYIKQILTDLKGEIDNTVIVDVNTYFQQ